MSRPTTDFSGSHATLVMLQKRISPSSLTLPAPPKSSEPSHYIDAAFNLLGQALYTIYESSEKKFDDLMGEIRASRAIQVNALRKWLDESVEPVSVLVEHVDGTMKYGIPEDFPLTIRDFWKLEQRVEALVRLAKHYQLTGWENWNRAGSDDTDITTINELETAVAAQPLRCLKILAAKWGLQFSLLEHPNPSTPSEKGMSEQHSGTPPRLRPIPSKLGKRQLEIDSDSGRKRHKTREFSISRLSGNIYMQERVLVGSPVPYDPSVLSERIGWRAGSTPSDDQWLIGNHGLVKRPKIPRKPSSEHESSGTSKSDQE